MGTIGAHVKSKVDLLLAHVKNKVDQSSMCYLCVFNWKIHSYLPPSVHFKVIP